MARKTSLDLSKTVQFLRPTRIIYLHAATCYNGNQLLSTDMALFTSVERAYLFPTWIQIRCGPPHPILLLCHLHLGLSQVILCTVYNSANRRGLCVIIIFLYKKISLIGGHHTFMCNLITIYLHKAYFELLTIYDGMHEI